MSPKNVRRASLRITLLGLWAIGLIASLFGMSYYESVAGASAQGSGWPSESRLKRNPGAFQLVLFAHPHCPCTPATLSELARAVATATEPTQIHVVLVGKGSAPSYWKSVLPSLRKEGVVSGDILHEQAEIESPLFGAETSGQIFLFDPEGGLQFKGGITASRGHEGDNVGRTRVAGVLRGVRGARLETPVFGCPL